MKSHPRLAFAPGRPGPRILRGPTRNPRPTLHHGAGRGTIATEWGRAGPLSLPPGSFPVPGPRPVHRLYFVAYLPIPAFFLRF